MSLRVEAASQINPKLELETVGSVAEHPSAEWLNSVNSSAELECLLKANSDTEQEQSQGCPPSYDSVLCWPRTPPNTLAVLPCFKEFKGVQYDSTHNATRFCHANSTWDNYSSYDQCHHVIKPSNLPDFSPSVELPTLIYCSGYFLSLIGLTLALLVFVYFKDLKCLRNTIHANLFLTYILSALLWILTLFLQVLIDDPGAASCTLLVILFHYFNLTNFFWMLVEGLYLYTLVVLTFSSDNIKFWVYAFIGWGCPALVVLTWSICKVFTIPLDSERFNGLEIECSWMRESTVDWIFQGPACMVLILNLIFLMRIMWVLITKLRSANTLETRQYRKASKALLVLIPLLGITYLLVLTGPEFGIGRYMFDVIRAFLISSQGFSVSLFYCFLNSEVRLALRHKLDRWRDERNINSGQSTRNRRYRFSKDYSPRSRTESLRLTTTFSPIPTNNE